MCNTGRKGVTVDAVRHVHVYLHSGYGCTWGCLLWHVGPTIMSRKGNPAFCRRYSPIGATQQQQRYREGGRCIRCYSVVIMV